MATYYICIEDRDNLEAGPYISDDPDAVTEYEGVPVELSEEDIKDYEDICRRMLDWTDTLWRWRSQKLAEKKPAHGTQAWAETYSDDLGESPDY